MTHTEQLSSPLYRYWVKAGLGFKYLKCGLEQFVDNEVKELQDRFLHDICKTNGVKEAKCTKCTTTNTIPCPTYGICNVRKGAGICTFHERSNTAKAAKPCPNSICNTIHQKIKDQHRHKNPSWKNTDACQWCINHWQIAKCYLPVGGYEDKTSATETDCSGLLNVINNCLFLQNGLDVFLHPPNDIVSKLLKTRNDIFHSAKLELTEDQLICCIDEMIDLLQDKKKLLNDTEAQKAVAKLKELKDETFFISTMDEHAVLKAALNGIEEKTADAIHAIESMQTEVMKAIEARLNDLQKETRMDAMTNTEDEHRQQIEYSRKKQELQSKLCSIYEKHLSTIPVSPVLSEIEASIDDVFVELVICDDLIHEPKTLEKRTNTGRQVKDYRDVIYKNGEKCKNIYVFGEAGMGKTTWCMNLLNTWVRAFKKNTGQMTSANEPMTTDERTISDFDVVLFASLRHATSDGNIRDMIDHQLYLEHPELVDITTECIEKEPHKCLIVLDGLDEWSPPNKFIPSSILQHPGLPCRKDLHDCTVLTTTRPWKMDMVRLKDNDIDRAVKIQGIKDPHILAEKIINSLHRKCFKEMNKTAKYKDVDDFENHVREVFHMDTLDLSHVEHSVWENMPSFMEVPLILVFMICVWFQKSTLERTLAANYSELLAFLIANAEGDNISGKLGRLSDKTNLQILKDKWSVSAGSLPDCIKRMDNCKGYSGLLLRLSRLAFYALFDSDGKENSLVFTAVELKSQLTDEELEVAVKIGILSQSKAVGNVLSRESSLSFLHKTIQEYLAAMHLVCSMQSGNCEAVEKYKDYCISSWIRIREMENILIFVCGMNPHIASELSEYVASVAEDLDVTDEIDNLTFSCVQEVSAAHGMAYPSSLYPIHAYRVNIILSVDDTFKHQFVLLKTNKGRIKYLSIMVNFEVDEATTSIEAYANDISFEDEEDDVPENKLKLTVNDKKKHLTMILEELQQPQCNQCLVTLSWIGMPFSSIPMHVLPNALSQMSKLRSLELSDIRQTASSSTVMDVDLSNCHSLAQFRCSCMSHFTFTLQQNKLELLYLCDLRSCNVNIHPTNNHLSSGETAFWICKGAEITCNGLTICKIYLVTTCREIEHVQFHDCKECDFVICTDNTEHVKRSRQDPLISIGTILKEITCTEVKNSKITLTTTCREIGNVFIGNCNECEFAIDTGNTETVEESTEYIGTIIKQITCTETKKCTITLETSCWAIDHVDIEDCASFEFVIDIGNTKSVQGSIRDHVINIRTAIKQVTCTKTKNSKITLTTSCSEIELVNIDECDACEVVIQQGNTKQDQGSIQDHVDIRTTIKQINCTQTKNSKISLTAACTEIGWVYIDNCDVCEFVIQQGNTKQDQGSIQDHVDSRTTIKQINCIQTKNSKIYLTATCTEIYGVSIDNCDVCEFVIQQGNTKQDQGSIQDHVDIRTTIKQINCIQTKNSKISLTATCTEIYGVSIENCDVCEFVIQQGNTKQDQGSIQDHVDSRTTIKKINCTQTMNSKKALTTTCTDNINNVELRKCKSCKFVINTGYSEKNQGYTQSNDVNIRKIQFSSVTGCMLDMCAIVKIKTMCLQDCSMCSFRFQWQYLQQLFITKNGMSSCLKQSLHEDALLSSGDWDDLSSHALKEICKQHGADQTSQQFNQTTDTSKTYICGSAIYYALKQFIYKLNTTEASDTSNLLGYPTIKRVSLSEEHALQHHLILLISYALLGGSDWQPLGAVLHSPTQLEILELEDDRNSSAIHPCAIMSLQHLTHLRQLVCRYLPIDSWEALGNILPSMKQLEIFNLEGSHQRHVPSSVVQALKHHANLTHLECRCFSDAAWEALGKILPYMPQLTILYLKGSHQTDVPSSVIVNLKHHVNLTHLECRCFSDAAWDALGKILLNMPQLTILYLKGSDQTDVPSSVFVNLKHCVNLTHLACIHLSGVVWEELGKCLSSMPQLEILNVEGLVRSRVPLSVIHCIEQLTHIKHLTCVCLDDASWEDLGRILFFQTQIEILKMKGFSLLNVFMNMDSLQYLTNLKHFTLDLEYVNCNCEPTMNILPVLMDLFDNLPHVNHILEVELHNVKNDIVDAIKSLPRFRSQVWEESGYGMYSATLKSMASGT